MKKLLSFLAVFSIILFAASCDEEPTAPKNPKGHPNFKVDTVIVVRVDTVKVPVVRVDTVKINTIRIDTVKVNVVRTDTVYVNKIVTKVDTVFVPKLVTKYDTVFVNTGQVDTVYRTKTDTIYVDLCDPSVPPGHRPKSCDSRGNGKP